VLGEGAFSIVYACEKVHSPTNGSDRKKEDLAVKMVDKVESPINVIQKEVDLLTKLSHPNVLRFIEVFWEKCFVCIVVERYCGGDLFVGMQLHWDARGKIPCDKVMHVQKQILDAVKFLHAESVMHRDIKGDNYLIDREDILEQECRVTLADFGTACRFTAGERLEVQVGTRTYWAPEVFHHSYLEKVDVWAMGIVICGLLTGQFPFNSEGAIVDMGIPPKVGGHLPKQCLAFLEGTLEKDEGKRLSAALCQEHPWIVLGPAAEELMSSEGEDEEIVGLLKEEGANAGIHARRVDLVERMENQQALRRKSTMEASAMFSEVEYWRKRFRVYLRPLGKELHYEWWPQAKVDEFLSEGAEDMGERLTEVEKKAAASNIQVVGQQLEDHGIQTSIFGTGEAKSLRQFADEVTSGASRLMLDAAEHKKLVRVVDVVLLRLCEGLGEDTRYLVETGEKYADGRERKDLNRLPGTKKEPYENTRKAALRVLDQTLDMGECNVSFDFTWLEVFEEDQEESPSYPGVRTVYRKEIVEGWIESSDEVLRRRPSREAGGYRHCATPDIDGTERTWSFTDYRGNIKWFAWWTEQECADSGVSLFAPEENNEVSGLVHAPIGFSEDALLGYLIENGLDPGEHGWGRGSKRLKDLSSETQMGETTFAVQDDGTVLRVVDVVLLKLSRPASHEVLVQTCEVSTETGEPLRKGLNRLPGTKRRPDENHFVAAQRALRKQLQIDQNNVDFNSDDVQTLEATKDSDSYPGLRTLYRKRVIRGEVLLPIDEPELSP